MTTHKDSSKTKTQNRRPTGVKRGRPRQVNMDDELDDLALLDDEVIEDELSEEDECMEGVCPDDLDDQPATALEGYSQIGLYLHDISRCSRVTPAEEITLAKLIRRGQSVQKVLDSGRFEPDDRARLEAKVHEGREARNRLVEANVFLAVSIAKNYAGQGVPLPDLVQEGNLALLQAAETFDIRRRCRFSTYATWVIRYTITTSIADQGRFVRLPTHAMRKLMKLARASDEIHQSLGREPTPAELAQSTGLPLDLVKKLLKFSVQPFSVEQEAEGASHEDDAVGEWIEEMQELSAVESMAEQEHFARARRIVASIPAQESLVLRMRFGLDGGIRHTLAEIGQRMGFTAERIRQLEAQALARLRDSKEMRRCFDEVDTSLDLGSDADQPAAGE